MRLFTRFQFEDLADAMLGRRDRTAVRFIGGAALALICLAILPWPFIALCVVAFGTLQLAEWWAFDRERVRAPDSFRSVSWAMGCIIAQGLVLGGLALALAERVAPLGPVIGICYLLGCLSTAAMGSRRSILALCAGLTPYILYFTIVIERLDAVARAPRLQVVTIVAIGLLFLLFAIVIWRQAAQLSRSEAEARGSAQAANTAKTRFIAAVTHELRTPISAILAGAADLQQAWTDPPERRRASLIVDAAQMMRVLLDDLLDHSKVEAGRMDVEMIAYDARQLIADTLRFWQAQGRKRGVRLAIRGGKSLPQWLTGDPTRLRQILNNLFSNGIKFSDRGTVSLQIAFDTTILELTVADEGVGMSAEQLARLFIPFSQADPSISRTHGGTGLGLALSRDLARLMGGELTVESTRGVGSRFTVSIPLSATEHAAQEAEPDSQRGAQLPPIRILSVDDHEINRRAMSLLLEAMGLDASYACDGEEALERLNSEAFDVVLMDVHMPKLDGMEVARRVRASLGPNRTTPIIAVSGNAEPAHQATCLAAGMTLCVGKPIQFRELHQALIKALDVAPAINQVEHSLHECRLSN